MPVWFAAIPFLISVVPNVYYGITKGDWLLGWDYALTGKDYVGEFVDKIFPEPGGGGAAEGLSGEQLEFLNMQLGNLQDLLTVAIVAVVFVGFLILARGRK